MRVLGIEFQARRSGKDKGPLTAGPKQPDNFYKAAIKYKDRPGCLVKFAHREKRGVVSKHVDDIPLSDMLEVARSIEKFISDNWGGGYWQVQILDSSNDVVCTYEYAVGGPIYNTQTGKKRVSVDADGSNGDGAGRRRRTDLLDEVMIKRMEADPMEMAVKLATIMQGGQGGDHGMDPLTREIVTAQFNNNISTQENRMDELKSIFELAHSIAPKVAPEDPLSSIIQAFPAIIGGLGAMKAGGNAAPVAPGPQVSALPEHAGNGGIDMNALRDATFAIPQVMIDALPPKQQAAVMQLRQTAPAGGQQSAVLPRPGAPIQGGQPPQVGGAPVGGFSPGATGPPASPYHAAIDNMIGDIRGDLAAGVPDSNIAKKMISMVTYAKGFGSESPHPMLAGIMSATDESGGAEFAKLCNQIPELQGNEQRIQSLGAEILTLMRTGATETLDSLEDTAVDEKASDIADHPEPAFLYETEADREATEKAEAVTNAVNVLGSSRIPDQGSPAEQPGGVQDRADSEKIRQTA